MSGIQQGGRVRGGRQTALRLSMRVWDAPTRLFHWAIVLLVAGSYVSIQFDRLDLHFLFGYAMLTLLLFRLAWGFVGSDTSRFGRFVKSPVAGLRHLAQFRRVEPDNEVGHNAAGGWMVLGLLGLLALQVSTGLFANDDSTVEGPLEHLVKPATSNWLSMVHSVNFNIIVGAIVLHVSAIAAYAVIKRHNLLRPMITGRKRLPGNFQQPRMASSLLALMLLILSGCAVWVLVTRV